MSMCGQCFFKPIWLSHSGQKQWRQQHISSIACQVRPLTEKSPMNFGTTSNLRREIYRLSSPSAVSSMLMSLRNDTKLQAKSTVDPLVVASLVIWTQRQCTKYGILNENASSTLTT